MQMNVTEAKAKLSELPAAAEAGEEAVIARDGTPVAKIVPVPPRPGFRIGIADGQAGGVPDLLEPMTEDELARWG